MTTTSPKLAAGSPFPDLRIPRLGGGLLQPASDSGWRLVIVYRGKHCPLCKHYLDTLQGMLGQFAEAGITPMAISADPEEKAAADALAQGWTFSLGYDLSLEQMARLGLYVSSPCSPQETDRPFAEPALFVINPEHAIQIIDISNAPFARPDLAALLSGLKFIRANDYPVRGTLPV